MPIQPDDVLLNKATIIERCVKRIREEFAACPGLDDFTHVDALTLNVERACQATIDICNHIIAVKHFGIPQSNANSFEIIHKNGLIDESLFKSMKAMSGFRNVAVHEYQSLKTDILLFIAEKGHMDFVRFAEQLGLTLKID